MNTHLKAATKFTPKSPQSRITTTLQRHSIGNSLTVNTINHPNSLHRQNKLSLPGNLQTIPKHTSNNPVEQRKKYSENIDSQINFKKSLGHTLKTIDVSASKNTVQSFKIPKFKIPNFSRKKQKYGALRLINRFKFKIPYRYRWGNRSWKSRILSPDASRYHAWKYRSSKSRSPNFQIKFNANFRRGQKNILEYPLKRKQSSGKPHQNAKKYYFVKVGISQINLIPSSTVKSAKVNKIQYQNIKKALNLLSLSKNISGPWKKLDWNVVKGDALQNILNYQSSINKDHRVNQKSNSLCGPAVILDELVSSNPIKYAKLVRKIFQTGEVNGKRVNNDLLRNQHPRNMNSADWMVMSAMRDEENFLINYEGTSEEKLSGITTPSEIAQWMKSIIGCVDTKSYKSYLWDEIKNTKKIKSLFDSYGEKIVVAMLVDSRLLQKKNTFLNIPTHWIRLLSPIKLNGNTITFKAFTWGSIKEYKFNAVDFENIIFEFIVGAKEKRIAL